jgi:hypothetical protein
MKRKLSEWAERRLERQVEKYRLKSKHSTAASSDRYAAQIRTLLLVEETVKSVTGAAGAPTIIQFWYLSFGKQVYGLWRRLKREDLSDGLAPVRAKWQARGLEPRMLEQVEQAVLELLKQGEVDEEKL